MRYLLFFLMVLSFPVYGQDISLKLLDAQTNQPVSEANICIETIIRKNKLYILSDFNGNVKINISERAVFAISAMGYITLMDTLNPGARKTLLLQPKPFDIDEVVITGQHGAVKADKSIYKVNVVTNAQIKERAANNLTELLSTELNMRVSQDASLGSNISIQGLSGEHVKILIDGIPIIGRQNGFLDLSQVLLSNVDHIEIIEGPMSVIYGSNAIAGAINIITKQTRRGKITGKVNLDYESVGVYNVDGLVSINHKKNSFSINGGRNFFKGFGFSDTSRVKEWKPKEQYFTGFDYMFSNEKVKLKINANLFREKLINAGSYDSYIKLKTNTLPSGKDTTSVFVGYNASDQYHYTTRISIKEEFQYIFSPTSNIESTFAISTYNKVKNTYIKDFADLSEILADSSVQDTTKFRNFISRTVFNNSVIPWMEYMAGADFNIETATGKRLKGDKRIDDYALFSSIKLFPQNKINVQVGARTIYNSLFTAPLIYSLNLKYAPNNTLGLRVSYGKGFRAPTLKELYLIFQDINHNVYGNENLKAEYSQNYSLSMDYNFFLKTNHTVNINWNLFYNKISNKIDFIYDKDNPSWAKYYNIASDNFISKGAEIIMKYNFHPRFTFSSGIHFLSRSKVSDLNTFFNSTDYSIDFNYKNLKYLFRLSAYYKFTDDWYTSRLELNKTGESKIEDGYIKGYHTLNITISRPFFKDRLELAVGGKNLFGNTSVFSSGVSENVHGSNSGNTPVGWGRTYFIRLSYNFIKY